MDHLTRRRLRGRLLSTEHDVQKKRVRKKRVRRNARSRHDDGKLIDSLVHIHRLVMSGSALDSSIAHAALVRPSFAISAVQARSKMGDSIEAACHRTLNAISENKRPTPEERDSVIALHVLSVAGSIGGRVVEQIESLIDILNEREHLRRERRTQAASAAASMRLLTWLPIVCGAWILIDSPEIRHFLLQSPSGWMCLVLGVGSNIVGRLWLQHEVSTC